uniref:uncharacterized protein LOC120326963 n=1 Tax=Styela clava TaxID=7725 RepID=UPI00193A513B|nr:uncharacterized protein LOC120326963 [Styela clava]
MLLRLITEGHKSSQLPAIAKTLLRPFSTTPTAISAQSSDKFYLRHQLESKHVSSSKWKMYRIASVGLLGGLTTCFLCPGNPMVDFATVTLLVHHNYAGLNSVFADYLPLLIRDSWVKLVMVSWLLMSIFTLALLYSFNYNNVGFSKVLVSIFKL